MATVEHEQPIPRGPSRPLDHHVFVSAGGRRQSALRAAGFVAGALALVWLVALGLALAGSTRLPGLPVPGVKPAAVPDVSAAPTTALKHSRALARAARAPSVAPPHRELRRAAPSTRTRAPARATQPAPTVAPVASTPPTIQTATATPTQGWTRRGWTAPPGQTKRNEPTPRATGRPTDSTTTTGTTHGNGHGKG
jgi:hypothetical protein